MRRVSVVGVAGAGETTLARRLARARDVQHVELAAILHQPGWTELPAAELRGRDGDELAADGWVVDRNHGLSASWSGPLRTPSSGSIGCDRP